jgi:hypothetical protein
MGLPQQIVDSLIMADDLDKLLRDQNAFAEIARRLGQDDPQARRWEPAANENAPRKPRGFWQRIWNSSIAPILGLWVGLGYPAACLVLLWDEHHPWLVSHYPFIGIAALVSFFGPLAIACFMYWRWKNSAH